MSDEEPSDELRAQFPMSFGKQAGKKVETNELHAGFKRPTDSGFVPKPLPLPGRRLGGKPASSPFQFNFETKKLPDAAVEEQVIKPSPSDAAREAEARKEAEAMARMQLESQQKKAEGAQKEQQRKEKKPVSKGKGKGKRAVDQEEEEEDDDMTDEDDFVGPPMPMEAEGAEEDEETDMQNEAESTQNMLKVKYRLPVTHEAELKGHSKTVTALALDPSGSRLLTGSNDYTVKMWDFAGMHSDMRSFRSIEPHENHQVQALSFSPTGAEWLVCTGNAQAKLYDRDGKDIMTCVKGDMYISDMTFTKGHTHSLTGGQWHPSNREQFITSSLDGTVRVWDTTAKPVGVDFELPQKHVLKARNGRGLKTAVYCCCYSPDGSYIGAGCEDGSLQLWQNRNTFQKADVTIREAHRVGSETSSVKFFSDNRRVLSRGGDDTLKIWDIRNASRPIKVWDDLPNHVLQTEVTLSPDEQLILTGTSVKKNEGNGVLVMIDAESLEKVSQIGVSDSSVVRILWHPKINQILIGSADAKVHMLYDPTLSDKGAMLFVGRKSRQKREEDLQFGSIPIMLPNEMDYVDDDDASSARQRVRARKDPIRSKKPPLQVQGPGGGKVAGPRSMTQFIMQEMYRQDIGVEDARAEFLKHAKAAEENPQYVTKAYTKTQPKPIFDYSQYEDDSSILDRDMSTKCPNCGMKLCVCKFAAEQQAAKRHKS